MEKKKNNKGRRGLNGRAPYVGLRLFGDMGGGGTRERERGGEEGEIKRVREREGRRGRERETDRQTDRQRNRDRERYVYNWPSVFSAVVFS